MEMTETEIIKKYKEAPSLSRIQMIADLNGCTTKEIREILRSSGESVKEPKKRGSKPKKNTKADATKKDDTTKTSSKAEPVEVEKPAESISIPVVVLEMCQERINYTNRQISAFIESIDQLNLQREELIEFQKLKITIPDSILDMTREKILSLNRQIAAYVEAIDQLNEEIAELKAFMNEGEKRDESNELHRKV